MTNGVARAVRTPSTSPARAPWARAARGACPRSLENNNAEIANVPALAPNAAAGEVTARRSAPTAGPTTIARSCTVCSSALAGPSRDSPTRRGRRDSTAGRSAQPAADASATTPRTRAIGPWPAAMAASASMSTRRSEVSRPRGPAAWHIDPRPHRRPVRAARTGASGRSSRRRPRWPSASRERRKRAAPRCRASRRPAKRRSRRPAHAHPGSRAPRGRQRQPSSRSYLSLVRRRLNT